MGTDKDVSTGAVSVIESHNNILFDLKRDAPVVVRLKDKEFNLEQAQKLLGLEVGSTVCDTGFEKILDGKMPEKSKAYELGFKKIEN